MDTPAAPISPTLPQPAVSSLPVEALSKTGPAEFSSRRWLLWLLGGLVMLIIGIALGIFGAKFFSRPQNQSQISSYQDCLTAKGSIVQESYPTTCVTATGQRFVQPLTDEEKQSLQPPDLDPEPDSSAATADWKTYTNSQMGFSLKHPIEYFEEEVIDLGPYDKRIVFKSQENKISSFSISTSPAKLPQYPYDQKPNGDYSLDGYQGVYLELPKGYADAGESSPPPLLALYIQKGEILYQIKFFGVSGLSEVLVTQILSTFKFTN